MEVNKNVKLVEKLQRYGIVRSKKIVEVMETIDRGLFVPDVTTAYVDSPMHIGYNATISAPHMHATCLELLEGNLQPGMHALDVGSDCLRLRDDALRDRDGGRNPPADSMYSGSQAPAALEILIPSNTVDRVMEKRGSNLGTGYLTACFALMVGSHGRAVGVEHIPELADTSIKNIQKSAAASLLEEDALSIHVGDYARNLRDGSWTGIKVCCPWRFMGEEKKLDVPGTPKDGTASELQITQQQHEEQVMENASLHGKIPDKVMNTDKSTQSYVDLVRGSKNIPNEAPTLLEVGKRGDTSFVSIPAGEVAIGVSQFNYSLIGRLDLQKVKFTNVQEYARNKWKISGQCKLIL
ncbi:hypothetical protein GIB67_027743 [Kingdonia uniflora]|uniref:Protein-L-isoaspartate O-methyltransferase n=1 Tax=Kingdonia uniflora TaxID=39325 RepID=A0A7J7PC73_9MAGN|nr:hypothetical protein GIB67_027743 [Kingdonia uniflora]